MTNVLLRHAMENVWCVPEQDNQYTFSGYRISHSRAEVNRFVLMNRSVDLPVNGVRFHVYQIGQLHPSIAGLLPPKHDWYAEIWQPLSVAVNYRKTYVDLFTDDGHQLPRYKSWYMFTRDRCLLLAVERDRHYNINYLTDRVYLHLYRNAYFRSLPADEQTDTLYTEGQLIRNTDDILAMQARHDLLVQKPGFVSVYRDGLYIDKPDIVNLSIGHRVEMIYDASFKKKVVFNVSQLPSFRSSLDNKNKYLLHHQDLSNTTVDFIDDIDVHVFYERAPNRFVGRYYHRNLRDSLRNVTHRDYSIPVDAVTHLCNSLAAELGITGTIEYSKFYIELKIRHSGTNRPLVFDHQRIFELYKLPDHLVLEALVGSNATVAEWTAAALETSGYCKLMRASDSELTLPLVQEAYGYHSLSRVIGDSPLKTTDHSGFKKVSLPYAYRDHATIYEYDVTGRLLGYHYHQSSSEYLAASPVCSMVEAYVGKGNHQPHLVFGKDNLQLSTKYSYRVYMCYENGGIGDNQWKDITGSEHYRVENNKLIWNNLEFGYLLMVKFDDSFLAYDLELQPVAGTYYFTFSQMEDRDGDANYLHYQLGVPYGEMDLFLNGYPLIQGLDYRVEFPKVYILNKKWLKGNVHTDAQSVHVRMTGFCRRDMTMEPMEDYGFIEHGTVSDNVRFNVRDDRVLRINIGGKIVCREDVRFAENDNLNDPFNLLNGSPYQVRDRVIPMLGLTTEDTYSLRAKSKVVDKHVSDYLTIKLPEQPRISPNVIPSKYYLISPFACHLLHDLMAGNLNDEIIGKTITVNQIIAICERYKDVMRFDPAVIEDAYDPAYVTVIPHGLDTVVSLDLYLFRFYLTATKLYCKDRVDISAFVKFSTQ